VRLHYWTLIGSHGENQALEMVKHHRGRSVNDQVDLGTLAITTLPRNSTGEISRFKAYGSKRAR
jgi:hypothetical protein